LKLDNLARRLATLENRQAREELVPFSFQWLNEDGTPASERIERRIPRSRMFELEWIDEVRP
jgi:tRNA A37 N6-isopentenylltransferase MiaA